jgi:hypothetical protein
MVSERAQSGEAQGVNWLVNTGGWRRRLTMRLSDCSSRFARRASFLVRARATLPSMPSRRMSRRATSSTTSKTANPLVPGTSAEYSKCAKSSSRNSTGPSYEQPSSTPKRRKVSGVRARQRTPSIRLQLNPSQGAAGYLVSEVSQTPGLEGVDGTAHGFGRAREAEAHEPMTFGGVKVDAGGRGDA